MRISNALLGIILTFTPWNVRASKNSMSGTAAIAAAAATAAAARDSVQRELLGMSSNKNNNNSYEYRRTYITIIEPDNFVSTDPDQILDQLVSVINQFTLPPQTIPTFIGTSTIQNGTFLLQFIYHIIQYTLRLLIFPFSFSFLFLSITMNYRKNL